MASEILYQSNGGGSEKSKFRFSKSDNSIHKIQPCMFWSKKYIITYDPTGGEMDKDKKEIRCNFSSWNTHPQGKGEFYVPGDKYSKNADLTLYAQWASPEAGNLTTPTQKGKIFLGWYCEELGKYISPATKITKDITVTAKWANTRLWVMTKEGWRPWSPNPTESNCTCVWIMTEEGWKRAGRVWIMTEEGWKLVGGNVK